MPFHWISYEVEYARTQPGVFDSTDWNTVKLKHKLVDRWEKAVLDEATGLKEGSMGMIQHSSTNKHVYVVYMQRSYWCHLKDGYQDPTGTLMAFSDRLSMSEYVGSIIESYICVDRDTPENANLIRELKKQFLYEATVRFRQELPLSLKYIPADRLEISGFFLSGSK